MKKIPFLYNDIKKNKDVIDKTVIAFVGLQLTRKAQAAIVAKRRGYFIVSTGEFIRRKCEELGYDLSFNSVSKISKYTDDCEVLRYLIFENKHSDAFFNSSGVIVDSIKSFEGIEFLIKNFLKVIVVGFLAPTLFRYKHSKLRNRSDESKNANDFDLRDEREIEKGLANILVFSDYFVLAGSIKETRSQFEHILDMVEK